MVAATLRWVQGAWLLCITGQSTMARALCMHHFAEHHAPVLCERAHMQPYLDIRPSLTAFAGGLWAQAVRLQLEG